MGPNSSKFLLKKNAVGATADGVTAITKTNKKFNDPKHWIYHHSLIILVPTHPSLTQNSQSLTIHPPTHASGPKLTQADPSGNI